MTTILADWHEGIMVSDSQVSDCDRQWSCRKVFRVKGALIGIAGDIVQGEQFLNWYKGGQESKPPKVSDMNALVMTEHSLLHYHGTHVPMTVSTGREAIGTGAKAAMVGYELTGWKDARRVVRLVCKHDIYSSVPIRVYRL